ncbi:MAG: T9SS type A sorting domain-containing protein, partial [Flavicella sp.]|nr:T9SS type A sorting domain-containing protein [Flavicella sp.]
GHGSDGGLGGAIGGGTSAGITGNYEGLMDAVRYSNLEAWSANRINYEAQKFCDFDGDGITNSLDLDSDNDAVLDNVEAQTTAGFMAPPTTNIASEVGLNGLFSIYESSDAFATTGITPNITSATDTTADYLDIDSDDDGIPDNIEAQSTQSYTVPSGNVGLNGVDAAYENNDAFTATGLSPNNYDGATELDFRNTDSDNDGVLDTDESGLSDVLNSGSTADSDGDGLIDRYDVDLLAYNVNNSITDPISELTDTDEDASALGDVDYRDASSDFDKDGDGIPDNADLDDDNDGILDTVESGIYLPDADEDNDGIPNYMDVSDDTPGDGATDTNYTDGNADGIADVYDFDNDGIPNHLDIDSDNDGIPDNIEGQVTDGYVAPSGIGAGITDVNNDGVDDNYAGGLSPVETTVGTSDYLNEDSDNDGVDDIDENGIIESGSLGTDSDNDGLDDIFEGAELNDVDVNDEINDPNASLPNTDGANDVDYRDTNNNPPPVSADLGTILWLRADKEVTGSSLVSSWEDQSGDKDASASSNQPEKIDVGLNFNPTIQFDGSEYMEITSSVLGNNLSYDAIWAYTVVKSDANQIGYVFSEAETSGRLAMNVTNNTNVNFQHGNNTSNDNGGVMAVNEFNLFTYGANVNSTTPNGNSRSISQNGLTIDTDTGTNSGTGNNQTMFIGSQTAGSNQFTGEIAEIIITNVVPDKNRQQQIQSYLAIKYGITLDKTDSDGDDDFGGSNPDVIQGSYLLEDLTTTVWDYAANAGYHNDVAGIGRDDDMALVQKQSKSISLDAIVTIGLGDIAASNAANSNNINGNKSFLMWGNNGANISSTSSKTLLCSPEKQMDRVWKAVETGTIGSVEVSVIEDNGLNNADDFVLSTVLNTANTVKLLKVADDPAFTTNVNYYPLTDQGVYQSAKVDFIGTQYFTFCEVNGIFWNGDSNSWTGGSSESVTGAPTIDAVNSAADGDKVLVIDAESTLTNGIMESSANVGCAWVREDSKLVVNNDQFLEVNGEFVLDGEIRLIGDAQLIQSHIGLSNVQGDGIVYRDQQGSVPNSYRYHYWSSPVVKSLGNTNFKVQDVMHDGTTPTSENSAKKEINFVSYSDLNSLNGAATDPITIANYWIYTYFNGTSRSDWSQKLDDGNINIGEGYTMKSTGRSPQNYTFIGTPNDGTISKTISPNTTSLLGNPYPSVLNVSEFISDNDGSIDGTIYFWEHTGETTTEGNVEGHGKYGYEGGYSQRNQAMGVAANVYTTTDGTAGFGEGGYKEPSQYIAVGQGFFVSAGASQGGVVTFQNSQRAFSNDNVLFKSGGKVKKSNNDQIPNFKIGFDYVNEQNNEVHRQLGINCKQGNTLENHESGYDSSVFDIQDTDIFWDIPEIDLNLIIAGVGQIENDLHVPLGIVVEENQTVKLMVDGKEYMDSYDSYLVDLLNGRIYDLSNTISLTLDKGVYSDRFGLVFREKDALSVKTNSFGDNTLIYQDDSTQELVVYTVEKKVFKIELYSALGKKILENKLNTSSEEVRILTETIADGIYIVKVFTDKGMLSKKILIK